MTLPAILKKLRLPLIGAPMFIVSTPKLVIAQCKSGVIGSFPALNARPEHLLDEWLQQITTELSVYQTENPSLPVAPFAVNQIVHQSNSRLHHDVALCVKYKVPIVITSLRPPAEVVDAIHGYGGLVFHDVINVRHARKAIEQGVDGIIAVCAGAGGHAGTTNPFALVKEIRQEFDGILILSGSMSCGSDILAAQVMGADLAYIGTRFIATEEANVPLEYKEMIVESHAADIVYTPFFSGINGNYLRDSIKNAGMNPDDLPQNDVRKLSFISDHDSKTKAWRDIWSAGQGVGSIDDILPTQQLILRMTAEYQAARKRLCIG